MTAEERRAAIELVGEVAKRITVRFLVVDVAQTAQGQWIVIECNDGQESGYAAIPPLSLWQRIIAIENDRAADRVL